MIKILALFTFKHSHDQDFGTIYFKLKHSHDQDLGTIYFKTFSWSRFWHYLLSTSMTIQQMINYARIVKKILPLAPIKLINLTE